MENFENENLEATLEQEPPKLSAKEYVHQGMAELAEHPEQAPARKIGRPRIHPPGWKRDRKDPSVDPKLSALRSAAGKKGAAVIQGRKMFNAERRKYGRMFQQEFDKELEQVNQEILNRVNAKQYDHQFGRQRDKQNLEELVRSCRVILEGVAWGRTYPESVESLWDEHDRLAAEFPAGKNIHIQPENYRQFNGWPDILAEDITDAAKYQINLAELPLLKQLAIRSLETFLDWAQHQKDVVLKEIEKTIPVVERAIPKIVDGSIYNPPPPPEPPEPIKSFEEQWREYHERYAAYPKGESQPLETFEQKEDRLQRQAEEEMLRQKQLEHQRQMDLDRLRHFQSLPPDALEYLRRGNDIFGVSPHRR